MEKKYPRNKTNDGKSKNHERGSKGSEKSAYSAKREGDTIDNNGTRKGEEEPLFLWVEGVELSTFEGNNTQVQNIKESTKVHPTVNNMEENAVQRFNSQGSSVTSQSGVGLGVQSSGLSGISSTSVPQPPISVHSPSSQQSLLSVVSKDPGIC
ncbi:hypothetical protein V8G54_012386 [Vigna mungo]|uniref:Uncharacterized protein n=1 Tax=Vigna mungo TaxID=3915 RepID=A0AAQ3NR08_VIGMU